MNLINYHRIFKPMHDAGNYTVNNQFLMQFGRVFITSLFLERRLTLANTVSNFDYEKTAPQNELQALYLDQAAQHAMLLESTQTFGRAIWPDSTRGNLLCLRVSDTPKLRRATPRTGFSPVKCGSTTRLKMKEMGSSPTWGSASLFSSDDDRFV